MSSVSVPSDKEVSVFLNKLLDLVSIERDAEISTSALLFSNCPTKLLEQKGLALSNLSASATRIGLGGKLLIELERPAAYHTDTKLPAHDFRNGDVAEIVNAAESKKAVKKVQTSNDGIQGVIFKVTDNKVTLAVTSSDSKPGDIDIPERCRLQKLANTVTFDRMEKNLQKLLREAEDPVKLPTLPRILLGLQQPTFKTASEYEKVEILDENLNDSQKEAVQFAVQSANELALIHGPPGTGKTSTLVECIRQLVKQGKRLLVCGASNLAVDNILERLTPHLPSNTMTRLGHPARILPALLTATLEYQSAHSSAGQVTKELKEEIESKIKELGSGKVRGKAKKEGWDEVRALRKDYREREGTVVQSVVKQANVVLCTCHGAGGRQIQNLEFDVVIIDEAAQALEPACWIPILKGKKLILAGDHNQLPPTVVATNNKHTKPKKSSEQKIDKDSLLPPSSSLEKTMFDRLLKMHGSRIKRLLNIQYRMNTKIMAFSSKELYENELVADESVADRLLSDLAGVEVNDNEEILQEPLVFIDTAGQDMYERLPAPDEVTSLAADSKSNENEAVLVAKYVTSLVKAGVTPDQITIITPYNAQVALLSSSLHQQYPGLEIGSVDGMQGREKEVVILSLVRSNEKRDVGFLAEKRRLNVAMTRAKRCLVVIGDSSTVFNGGKFLKSWMNHLEENADVRTPEMLN